jgi:hypothetical protein
VIFCIFNCGHKDTKNISYKQKKCKILQKYLRMSEKSSTFAAAFEKSRRAKPLAIALGHVRIVVNA